MSEKLITVREASLELGISEKKIIELADKNSIPSYRLGGEFLRFRKEEILRLRTIVRKDLDITDEKVSTREFLYDFFYFNDFYIASFMIIAFLVVAIVFF